MRYLITAILIFFSSIAYAGDGAPVIEGKQATNINVLNINDVTGIDDTTETTIEAALDSLPNVTLLQDQTISFLGSLTVESDSVLNQDLTTDASPTFDDLTLGGSLLIGDGEYIGSVSDTDAIQINSAGNTLFTNRIALGGSGAVPVVNSGTAGVWYSPYATEYGFFAGISDDGVGTEKWGIYSALGLDDWALQIDGDGDVVLSQSLFINDDANSKMTTGLTINQGGADDEILAFKSSDVSHPFTDIAEDDTYGVISKVGSTVGGLYLGGFTDGDSNAVYIRGFLGLTDPTDNVAVIQLDAGKSDGAADRASIGNSERILGISNYATTKWYINGNGDVRQYGNLIISDGGYIGSASDTDAIQIESDGDVVLSQDLSVTGNITGANLNISNWDTAYSWGDHSTQNYFDKDSDTLFTLLGLADPDADKFVMWDDDPGEWVWSDGGGDVSASDFTADGDFLVGTGSGTYQAESGSTARTSLGLGTTNDVVFNTVAAGKFTIGTLVTTSSAWTSTSNLAFKWSGGGSFDNFYGYSGSVNSADGTFHADNYKAFNQTMSLPTGDVDYFMGFHLDVDTSTGGTINNDLVGFFSDINLQSGITIGGDVFGFKALITATADPTGNVYGYYLEESGANVDYGFYQNGSAANYLGGLLDAEYYKGREQSSDPSDPAEGSYVMWQSDGTGSGDDGDIMIKVTAGGSTKTITLVDFSAF